MIKKPRRLHLACLVAVQLCSALAVAKERNDDDEEPDEEPSVTATPQDGVVIEGDDFRVALHMLALMRFEALTYSTRPDELYFDVPRVRPELIFRTLDDRLELLVETELGERWARLLELQVDYELAPWLGVRAGLLSPPFSRASIVASAKLQFPDRSIISEYFRIARDIGVVAYRRPRDQSIEIYAGAFNGAEESLTRVGDTPFPLLVGRVVVSPFGRVPYNKVPLLEDANERREPPSGLSIGINGYVMERRLVETEPPVFISTGGIDLAAAYGGFSLMSEVFVRVTDDPAGFRTTAAGAYGQVGYFITPYELELAARIGWLDPNRRRADDRLTTYEATLNYYLVRRGVIYGHHIKMSLLYLRANAGVPILDLPRGTTHRLTAQLQLWF